MAGNRLGYKHKKVQRLRRLLRQTSMRETEKVFVIEGTKLLEEALSSGAEIESIFVAGDARIDAVDRAEKAGRRVHHLDFGVMERVAETVTPQPVVAVVAMRDASMSELAEAKTVAVLIDVRDPGNAGTILRSVEAAGNGAVIFCQGCVDVYNPKTVRSSAGSLFHLPFVRNVGVAETLASLKEAGFRLLATDAEGGTRYDQLDLSGPNAIVLGNEANGLPDEMAGEWDAILSIPIAGRSESLNVGMAMTVVAFESLRQRTASG